MNVAQTWNFVLCGFASQRVAAKIAGTLFYFQGDHLGSSSVAMTQSGTSFYSRQTYFPFGAQRTTEGSALPTDYTFTGQKSDDSTGLMFYGARYYDATLGRFTQPDTIVPSPLNPQSLNRFAYVLNNPVKYTDPTGHAEVCDDPSCGANPPSNPSNNGEVPTAPTEPLANPPVDSPTNPNPEQRDDCKRHCDDADRADGSPSSPTRTPKAEFRGKCLGYCTGDGEEEKRDGPIGNGTGQAGNGSAGGGCTGISAADCARLTSYYPPNRGFAGQPVKEILKPGTIIDRYGGTGGSFASPQGTPFELRSLPPQSLNQPVRSFEVKKAIMVDSGQAAPWFGQPGEAFNMILDNQSRV